LAGEKFSTQLYNIALIPSQIVLGVGFIGAGLIIFPWFPIAGLTTAAGLWVAAAIGVATAFRVLFIGDFATILIIFGFRGFLVHWGKNHQKISRSRRSKKNDAQEFNFSGVFAGRNHNRRREFSPCLLFSWKPGIVSGFGLFGDNVAYIRLNQYENQAENRQINKPETIPAFMKTKGKAKIPAPIMVPASKDAGKINSFARHFSCSAAPWIFWWFFSSMNQKTTKTKIIRIVAKSPME